MCRSMAMFIVHLRFEIVCRSKAMFIFVFIKDMTPCFDISMPLGCQILHFTACCSNFLLRESFPGQTTISGNLINSNQIFHRLQENEYENRSYGQVSAATLI